MTGEFGPKDFLWANQCDGNTKTPRCLDCAFDLRLGSAVRTHCVHGYDARHGEVI